MHKSEIAYSYSAYLLRLWQSQNAQGFIWHASLESPDGSEKLNFASLQALYDFLNNKTQALNETYSSTPSISSRRRLP